MHGSVPRSLSQSVRYLGAVVAGGVVAAAFGTAVGLHAWSLAVMMAFALGIARLQPLGSQRVQVPVTALFAFTSGGGQVDYGLRLLAAVAIGVGCGLLVTVALPPPLRHHRAEAAVAGLASRVGDLLAGLAGELRAPAPTADRFAAWRRGTAELLATSRRVRQEVEDGEERAQFNPRRMSVTGWPRMPEFHTAVGTLQTIAEHAQSIARCLSQDVHQDTHDTPDTHDTREPGDPQKASETQGPQNTSPAEGGPTTEFLHAYADLLDDLAAATETIGRVADDPTGAEDGATVGEVRDARIRQALWRYDDLVAGMRQGRLAVPRGWPRYGSLLVDARRVLDELTRVGAPAPRVSDGSGACRGS